MRKVNLIVISIWLIASNTYAQDLRKVTNSDERARTVQVFYVFADNPNIKQGEFFYKFKGKIQLIGSYENNIQSGEWVYTPDKELRIVGNYSNGKKDGVWEYFKNDNLISRLTFENGKLNGKCEGFYEDGQLASEALYINSHKEGLYITYYSNGNIKDKTTYHDGKIDGEYELYADNGELLLAIEFINGKPYNLQIKTSNTERIYYSGNLNNGDGEYAIFADNDGEKVIKLIRNYKDGKLDGEIQYFNDQGELSYKGQYEEGYMDGTWEFNIDKPRYKITKNFQLSDSLTKDPEERMYSVPELKVNNIVMPRFDNRSDQSFRKYITETLRYPVIEQRNGVSGRVITQFEVDKFGLIRNLKILKGVSESLDKEALRVVKTCPFWTPGFIDQSPVDVKYTFPIVFQLK